MINNIRFDKNEKVSKSIQVFMELPFYVTKKHTYKNISFLYDGKSIEIRSGEYGLPCIDDYDVLIYITTYIIGVINVELKKSKINIDEFDVKPPKRLSFSAYDFLKYSSRSVCGKSYDALYESLLRLYDTKIKTNFLDGNNSETWSRFIDEVSFSNNIEVKLSDWLYRLMHTKKVKTIENSYYQLKPSEKRVYNLIKKHFGIKATWNMGLNKIYKKLNVQTTIYQFRHMIRQISKRNKLPSFRIMYSKKLDSVYVFARTDQGNKLLNDFIISGIY